MRQASHDLCRGDSRQTHAFVPSISAGLNVQHCSGYPQLTRKKTDQFLVRGSIDWRSGNPNLDRVPMNAHEGSVRSSRLGMNREYSSVLAVLYGPGKPVCW